MFELTTGKTIALLSLVLIIALYYQPMSLDLGEDVLSFYAIFLYAFLPAFSYQLNKLIQSLTIPICIGTALMLGVIWFVAIESFFPKYALLFASTVACGNYLLLRLK
ncbi:hypothetical protein [Methylomarinum vadi]|uniref:hypothetical protein n=1 Tax=Methylomarinum vadi TaxID=438855 RepID=UPI0004DF2BF8|nr:hypothetical protein [Methylomarinum vadi]